MSPQRLSARRRLSFRLSIVTDGRSFWIIAVIQRTRPRVFAGMRQAVQILCPIQPRIAWRVGPAKPLAREHNSPVMPLKSDPSADGAYWNGLIEKIADGGDRAAFGELFKHFAPRVKTFMRRSGIAESSAEELAQETLLTVWRKAALFDPASGSAATWIFTISRNLRIDALRRDRRGGIAMTGEVEDEFDIDESPLPDAILSAAQSARRLRSVLAELPAEQRLVIELSFYDDKAHADIAKTLSIPLGTVKSRLRLAMSRLRHLLGDPA